MRIAYSNLIDTLPASSLTALSSVTGYSVINVQDQRLSTVWKSSTATTQSVIFTLPTLPDWPDDSASAHTIYLQGTISTDAWTGWTATSGFSVVSSNIVWAHTGANQALYKTPWVFASGSTIIARVRIASGNPGSTALYVSVLNSGADGVNNTIAIDGSWTTFSMVAPSTSERMFMWMGLYGNTATYTLEIDWMYIGDGTYTTQLADNSGNGNHGTIYGATPCEGVSGRALSFDGVNDYVAIPSGLPSGDISISLWAKLAKGLLGTLALLIQEGASHRYIYVYQNRICFSTRRADGTTEVNPEIPAANWVDGQWLHIVGVQDGATAKIYYNGVLFDSRSVADLYTSFSANGSLGVTTTANYTVHTIDEPRIYNRALSADEVAHLYAHEPFNTENFGLVGDWKVDKGLEVNTAAVMGHNLLPGTSVRIQGDSSANWTDPDYEASIASGSEMILNFATSATVYKYWRFLFSGQASIEIGRLWLGSYMTINPSSLVNFNVTKLRSDKVVHGRGRQKYANIGNGWRRFRFTFPPTSENMIYLLSEMYDAVGNHTSLIFCNFDTIRDFTLVEPCYVSLNGEFVFSYEAMMKAAWSIEMEEER